MVTKMKRNSNRRKKNLFLKKNNHNLTWLFAGLLLGIGITFFMHTGFPTHHVKREDNVEIVEKHAEVPVKKTAPRYDFYTILGKEEEKFDHPIEIPAPSSSQKYSLQVASFKSRQDADKLRAELIIQGYNVFLAPIKQGDNTLIRVQVGPFKTLKQAQKIQHELAESAIKTLLIKM
jgi:hypothetical protein